MSEDLAEKIKRWCVEQNLFEKEVENEKAKFHYIVHRPYSNLKLGVFAPKESKDLIILEHSIEISKVHLREMERILKINEVLVRNFVQGIESLLSRHNFYFVLEREGLLVKKITAQLLIYSDGLTLHRFVDSLNKLTNLYRIVVIRINQYFGVERRLKPEKDSQYFL
ncbi:MAG: DUF2299 family protein [Candidatus Methanofastidiosia archaeon]